MKVQLISKRLLALVLAFAMMFTGLPMNTSMVKAEDVSFTLDFTQNIENLDGIFLTAESCGAGWKVHSLDSNGVNRLLTGYLDLSKNGVTDVTSVFAFTAPTEGTYDLTADVYSTKGTGNAEVYVNDTYVGTLKTCVSETSADKLKISGVNLIAGDYANTIKFVTKHADTTTAATYNGKCYFYPKTLTFVASDVHNPGPEPTSAPTEAPTEAPTILPPVVPTPDPTETPSGGTSLKFDFGAPKQGLDGSDVTLDGGMNVVGADAAVTYAATTSLAGDGWSLNVARTTINKTDSITYDNAKGVYFHKGKAANAATYFDGARIAIRLFCGQVMAFDVEVPEAGLYEMEVVHVQSKNPATVTVNPGTEYASEFVDLIPVSSAEVKSEKVLVPLTLGTNTITFLGNGSANSYTAFRGILLHRVGDLPAQATPTPLPTLAPTSTPMPTEDPNAVKSPFEVHIRTLDRESAYTENDLDYYFTKDTKGANWAIHSSDQVFGASNFKSLARIFSVAGGDPYRVTLYAPNVAQVFSFTAPASGYYDLSALMYLHEEGGYADVYVNGDYVGTVDSHSSNKEEQKLLGVYLKGGELQNTISIKGTGPSKGSGQKIYWSGFDFSTPDTIATLTGLKIDAETTTMFPGDTQTIVASGDLTNGGLYRFSSVGRTVVYESSDPKVATINSSGLVTALKAGTSTITAFVPELGYSNTVVMNVADVAYDTPEINIEEGQEFMEGDTLVLRAKAKYNNGEYAELNKVTATFESSDESVVKIEDGKLYAIKPGFVTVTAHVTCEGVTLDVSKNIVIKPYTPPVAFEVNMDGVKNLIAVDSDSIYLRKESHGTNWVISDKTTPVILGKDVNSVGACRLFYGTYLTYLSLNRKGGTFVFEVDVQDAGKYDITANMMKHTSGGIGAIYVNDVYVGTVDAYAPVKDEFNVSKQPLLGVNLKKGVNTISVTTIGPSNGEKHYTMFTGFSFTTPETIATFYGIDATADVEHMYVGRKEQISVKALLTNNGRYDFEYTDEKLTYESSDKSVAKVSSDGLITAVGAGEVTITVQAVNSGFQDTLTFDVSNEPFDKVIMNVEEGENLYIASERPLEIVATLADGTVISDEHLTVTYASSDESVAKIEDGVLKPIAKGTAAITATAKFTLTNEVVKDVKNIVAVTIPLQSITAATVKPVVQELDTEGVQLGVSGIAEDGTVVEDLVKAGFTSLDYTFTSLNPELLTVDPDGICHYVSRGVAKVQVDAVIDGVSFSNVVDVVSSSGKKTTTIYTPEMVENARYNMNHYKWATRTVKKLAGQAFQYVYLMDDIYNLIPTEGVPRTKTAGTNDASDYIKFCCPACGVNVTETFGDWSSNILERPWKIWCPNCKVAFPTNDFELLYKRGLDENGFYNRELAYQRNAEAVARGEKDALVNELYPEMGPTWMVDDGFGWSPNTGTYGSSDMIQRAPVAKYMHLLWYYGDHNLAEIVHALAEYYLYTGDERFGRAGVILLDRIADVRPAYDVTKVGLNYHASDGSGNSGAILGSIAEANFSQSLIESYDALYPMFDDPEVVAYLSQKAIELGLENPKTNGNLIRENVENGIVRDVINGLQNGEVCGNFGYHQVTGTLAAIALDTQPETNQVFEWLLAPSVLTFEEKVDPIFGQTYRCRVGNTGGELGVKFINNIDRDGFGAEVSPAYNTIWLRSVLIADYLERYSTDVIDLYGDEPKLVNMIESFIFLTAGDGYTMQPGDGGEASSGKLNTNFANEAFLLWKATNDPVAAQLYYLYTGGDMSGSKMGIFENIRENLIELQAVIDEYGEYDFYSHNLTGYGMGIVRGGKAATKEIQLETRYDTWMYYGRTSASHAHRDMLAIGIDAYGFNFMPDLAAPFFKGQSANRVEWIANTVAHNTVVVNERKQDGIYTGYPLHFDSTDNVKVIDTEANGAYKEAQIYRRTTVSIAANEDVAYTLDFFRVKGGDQHTYSFHTTSYRHWFTDDLDIVPQVNEKGEYAGTYAGVDVPYGPDPNSTDAQASATPKYPQGYTWLEYVNRGKDKTNDGLFTVKFEQTDFKDQVVDSGGLAIKVHALNDWIADSVDLMVGHPAPSMANLTIPGYDYMLIQRKGQNLDTLFTTLLEPFKVNDYIYSAEPIEASIKSGTEGEDDIVKAVKVTLKNGRTDYVIYATNNDVTYTVTDGNVSFDFSGFVGVYSVDYFGKNIYTYVNDGTLIGNTSGIGTYTGTVVDFTKEYVHDDYIYIRPEQTIEDLSILTNQYIYVDSNLSKFNTVYKILSAEWQGENIALYLGNCSLIDNFVDNNDLSQGYVYSISDGQKFEIPVSLQSGESFGGTNRVFGGGSSSGNDTSVEAESTENLDTELTEEMLEEIYVENESDDVVSETTPEVSDKPSTDKDETTTEKVDGEPTATPDAADVNAGGKKVRNILLGGLGALALGAGIFLILLGKKKEEEE